jgi:hypothetical protein
MAEAIRHNGQNEANQHRPRMIAIVECFDQIIDNMHRANRILGSMMLDIEKAADWATKTRDGLIQTIEERGGDVAQAVEGQMRDFIGDKKYQQPQTTEGQ